MYINAFFAVFWLVLGIALLAFQWEYANGVSGGWVALLLALYNVFRCVAVYYRRLGNRESARTNASPMPPGSATEYYPMFDFTKTPAERSNKDDG